MSAKLQAAPPLDTFARLELLDAVSIGIWVFDGERPRYFNRAMADLTGYSQQELLTPGLFESILSPESLQTLRERSAARLRGEPGVPEQYEISLTSRSGEELQLAITACRVELSFGPASLVTAVDVTGSRRTEEALRTVDARYISLLDTVPVAVIIADAQGRPLYMNRAWQEFTGFSAEEALRSGIGRSIHPDDFPDVRAAQRHALTTGEGYVMDSRLRDRDGNFCWYQWRVDPVRAADGSLLGWTAAAMDIDKERETQQHLVEENEELDARTRAKDEVLGMISHELRTPLTTLRGNANIVSRRWRQLQPDDLRRALDDIGRDSERLQLIIENMLMLARAEAEPSLEPEPVLLGRFVPTVVEEFTAGRPERKVEVKGASAALPVMGNPVYLRQVLLNLLSNAQKYSHPEAPITVRLREGADTVTLAVEDRGPGIREQDRRRLFEPFFRAESTASTRPGIGLGLTVCKRLAEEQHGRLHVAPRRGGGTIFSLTLPLLRDGAPD